MLTTIHGPVGVVVGFGQLLTGDASRFQHAGILDGEGNVIEAAPRGVRTVPLSRYLDGRPIAFGWMIPLTDDERAQVVAEARALLGRRYSWLTYLYLALVTLGLHPRLIRKRVASDKRLICSALVDHAYARAGVHLFTDGRIPGDVTPGDLANLFVDERWAP